MPCSGVLYTYVQEDWFVMAMGIFNFPIGCNVLFFVRLLFSVLFMEFSPWFVCLYIVLFSGKVLWLQLDCVSSLRCIYAVAY